MITQQQLKTYGLLGSLYISQGLPSMFILSAVPVFLRQQGVSLGKIGLLSLVAIPLMLKFLWAPLIDNFGYTRWGHYRFWIIGFQVLLIVTTVLVSLINIQDKIAPLLICGTLMCFLCASQDIATDALAVNLLSAEEKGFGNGIQNAGNYLGVIIGGGGMLLVLERWGWMVALLSIAVLLTISLVPILLHRESVLTTHHGLVKNQPMMGGQPIGGPLSEKSSPLKRYFRAVIKFSQYPKTGLWCLILVLCTADGAMAGAMFRPLLVDIGLSLGDIALMLGVVSYTAGMAGAIIAGLTISSLGRKRSLLLFNLFQGLCITAYLLPAFQIHHIVVLYAAAVSVQLAGSMSSTALCTVMMDRSDLATAGSDYTVQSSLVLFSGIGIAAVSGFIAQAIGYRGLFMLSAMVALLSVTLVATAFDETVCSKNVASTPMEG
ncbi:MAG: MFS transporter [Cyanobacteria bacterium P01_A01_bin.15]